MKDLYQIAVLHERKDGKTKIIVDPCYVLAGHIEDARIIAGRKIPDGYDSHLEEVRILVSPFVRGPTGSTVVTRPPGNLSLGT